MHHLRAGEVEPAVPQDVRLDGHVRNVAVLHRRARLHFDETKPAFLPLQDVHRDVHTAGTERALADHRRAAPEKLPGARYTLVVGIVREVDHDPAGHVAASDLAHARAPVHRNLRLAVELELWRLRLVHHPPEELVALKPAMTRDFERPIVRVNPLSRGFLPSACVCSST